MKKSRIHTAAVPPARVPLSQAIKAGEWLFVSGQLGFDPRTGKLAEGGIGAQTRQVCENLKAILEAGGSSLDRVVKVTIYMADLALTTFQSARLVADSRVEIEAIAFCS